MTINIYLYGSNIHQIHHKDDDFPIFSDLYEKSYIC